MKIGIIVFSKTNNTFSVAERLRGALAEKGLDVEIERIIPENDDPGVKPPIVFTNKPDVAPYDMVIFASPVWAFSLAGVMKEYLEQVSSLQGKKVFSFVTKQLASKFTGGIKANRQIKSAVAAKNGIVEKSFIVSWKNKNREAEISSLIAEILKAV
ncbi:NAD(P)H-dependent oxidoreductase [uncultured Acetobacterium sp.]|uniref:flavodoxin family protein n=1 Tax=uncultured Acetobacterium sp. TaxID=217139 RepID=UPI0025F40B34|nr:NAD(P)H-dependent oxidoreductase [uncultured Acetobacterium sp.]MDP2843089.1 NAD(P)H-dependent oxidoreductase [Acetobacterium sp.]